MIVILLFMIFAIGTTAMILLLFMLLIIVLPSNRWDCSSYRPECVYTSRLLFSAPVATFEGGLQQQAVLMNEMGKHVAAVVIITNQIARMEEVGHMTCIEQSPLLVFYLHFRVLNIV